MIHVYDETVAKGLHELADRAVQERLWRSTGPPEVSSFDECLSSLWDDNGLTDAMDRPGVVFTVDIDAQLRRLDKKLSKVDPWQSVDDLLRDPKLEEIRLMARMLLDDLRDLWRVRYPTGRRSE